MKFICCSVVTDKHLNTSHVKVQDSQDYQYIAENAHLNTSHVKVQGLSI